MATWYYIHNTNFLSNGTDQQKCGPSTSGVQFCCFNDDTCLEDSICHYTHSDAGGSGYYIGGCTDPSFPEPCSKSCNDVATTDIVFTDASLNLWAFCYQHPGANIDCSNPSNETFYAPPPQSLTRQAASSSTTSSSAFASTSSTSTNSPTFTEFISLPPATPTHAPSSSLSAGGKAGVGVAASIVGLGIIILLGLYLLRKRRPRQHQEARVNKSSGMASSPRTWDQRHALETSAEQQWEMDGNARSEADGIGRPELEARWI